MMLGKFISNYLEENGIKQNFLTEKLIKKIKNMDNTKVSAMLTGRRKITADEYYLICKALNVDFGEFYKRLEKEEASNQ